MVSATSLDSPRHSCVAQRHFARELPAAPSDSMRCRPRRGPRQAQPLGSFHHRRRHPPRDREQPPVHLDAIGALRSSASCWRCSCWSVGFEHACAGKHLLLDVCSPTVLRLRRELRGYSSLAVVCMTSRWRIPFSVQACGVRRMRHFVEQEGLREGVDCVTIFAHHTGNPNLTCAPHPSLPLCLCVSPYAAHGRKSTPLATADAASQNQSHPLKRFGVRPFRNLPRHPHHRTTTHTQFYPNRRPSH